MNRNTETHFSGVPKIHQNRSKFDMSHSHKTTFNNGSLVPIYCDLDITPGDTVEMDMASLVRMATPIYPVMDNLVADVYWFFVPNRLLWDHWQEFWGQNDDPWTQQTEYEIPQIEAPSGGWTKGTIADYMGVPTLVDNISVNALGFRAYCKIYNDWFRDENLCYNTHMYTDETTRTGTNSGDSITNTELGALPVKVAKLHDRFTSALPSPQKGPAVAVPLGTSAPVGTGDKKHTYGNYGLTYDLGYKDNWGNIGVDGTNYYGLVGRQDSITTEGAVANVLGSTTAGDHPYSTSQLKPNNLYADLANATAATINQLRTAFAIQKFYEQAGRNGTRYIEFLRSVFGVESSDARLQRSQYLGGARIPINMEQILQTSATDAVTPQGNAVGFSCTISKDRMFKFSAEEHGVLLGLICTRHEHTYQQGLNPMWSRKKWTDYYNPYFANLSEQGIKNKEIYAQGTDTDEEIFGYQEAWSEYRYKENRVSATMRSNVTGSLDAWHYADDYNALPTLGSTWIQENEDSVNRTIAVTSEKEHQFIADFYFKTFYTRCMPVYSVPGLIDHV